LKEHNGDIKRAIEVAIAKNHSFSAKLTRASIASIPIVGIPPALVMPLWRQLREISLIAALNGHDVQSEQVQQKIIRCLALDASLLPLPIPSLTTTIATRTLTTQISPIVGQQIAENAAAQIGANAVKTVSEKASSEGISGVGYLLAGRLGGYLGKRISENTVAGSVVGQVTSKAMTSAVNTEVGQAVLVNVAKNSAQVQQASSFGAVAFSGALGMTIGIPIAMLLDYLWDNSRKIFDFSETVFSHMD